jgi:8-oxo-dGTP diphosphatase
VGVILERADLRIHHSQKLLSRQKAMATHRETSGAILIDSFGRFLFQQRDDNPQVSYPGLIGLFGGNREGNETFLECVVREVCEEISYFLPAERFMHLTSYEGADYWGGTIHDETFVVNNVPADRLVITEGSLLSIRLEDIATVEPRFSPPARFAMSVFLNDQQSVLSRLRT